MRWGTFSWLRRWVPFSLCAFLCFLWCFFVLSKVVVCLCTFVGSLCRFVASAWFYSTCIGLTCVILLVLFTSVRKLCIITFNFEYFLLFLPLWALFWVCRVITWAVDTFCWFVTHPDGPQCSGSPQLQHTACLPHLFSWWPNTWQL